MKNLALANKLKSARIKSGISVQSISKDLSEMGFKASPNTIYSWENGNSQPTPDAFLFLCHKYNIENILNEFGYISGDSIQSELRVTPANENLVKFRESTGLSQKQFAEKLGCKQNTYNGYETGEREPRLNFWLLVAKEFDTSIDYLLGRTDDHRAYYSPDERAEQDETLELLKQAETLNKTGKQKLLDYAEDLNKIEEYRA